MISLQKTEKYNERSGKEIRHQRLINAFSDHYQFADRTEEKIAWARSLFEVTAIFRMNIVKSPTQNYYLYFKPTNITEYLESKKHIAIIN